jgi:hypothetical protein
MKKSGKQGKQRVLSTKRVRGGVPVGSSLRAGNFGKVEVVY